MSRALAVVGCLLVAGCDPPFERTNPYDPKAPPEIRKGGTIEGRVEIEGRASNEGALVTLVGRTDLDAVSDRDGDYVIGDVPAGTYDVLATLPSRLHLNATAGAVGVSIGGTTRAPDLVLRKRPEPPIVMEATRAASDRARVRLLSSPDPDVTTYRVWMRTRTTGFVLAGEGAASGAAELEVEAGPLARGTTYEFRGSAVDADDLESDLSWESALQFVYPVGTTPRTVEDPAGEAAFLGAVVSSLVTAPDGEHAFFSEPFAQRLRRARFADMSTIASTSCPSPPDCIVLPGLEPAWITTDPEHDRLLVSARSTGLDAPVVVFLDATSGLEVDRWTVGGIEWGPLAFAADLGVVAVGELGLFALHLAAMSEGIPFVQEVPTDGEVTAVVAVGSTILIATAASPGLRVLDLGPVTAELEVPIVGDTTLSLPGIPRSLACGGSPPRCVAATQAGHLAFVDLDARRVTTIRDTGQVLGGLVLDGQGLAYGVDVAAAAVRLVSLDQEELLTCSSGCLLATGLEPAAVAIDGPGNRLLVSTARSGTAATVLYGFAY